MTTLLEVYITEAFSFFVGKRLNVKDIHKEMVPVYGGKCLSRKAVHNLNGKFVKTWCLPRNAFWPNFSVCSDRCVHNEELHNLYCSPSIVRMIMSGRMRWAGHVARVGEDECM
jgi:hypothetical protein